MSVSSRKMRHCTIWTKSGVWASLSRYKLISCFKSSFLKWKWDKCNCTLDRICTSLLFLWGAQLSLPVASGWNERHDDPECVGQHGVSALSAFLDGVYEDVHAVGLDGDSHGLTELAVTEAPSKRKKYLVMEQIKYFWMRTNSIITNSIITNSSIVV